MKDSEYSKDFIKIKFDSNDDLPINKLLNLFLKKIVNIIHKFIEMSVCMSYKFQNMTGFIFQKELILIKQVHQKNVIFVFIGTFQVKILVMSHIFEMVFMI